MKSKVREFQFNLVEQRERQTVSEKKNMKEKQK